MVKSASKPLLGVGPVGWVALATLIALVVAALCRDLQWDYLRLVGAIIGDGQVGAYVSRFHLWHSLSLLQHPGFSLVTMIPVVVAMRIHPAPFGWWRYALVVSWALFHPLFWITLPLRNAITRWFEAWLPALTWSRSVPAADGVLEFATAVVLLIATRSWRLALVVLALILGMTTVLVFNEQPGRSQTVGAPPDVVVAWHLAVAAIVLTWAIRARLTHIEEGCPTCGYDLTDLVSDRCPECGGVIMPGALHGECATRDRHHRGASRSMTLRRPPAAACPAPRPVRSSPSAGDRRPPSHSA